MFPSFRWILNSGRFCLRFCLVVSFALVLALQTGCGTFGNIMGVGHGGPKAPMGGVIIDGYYAYRGTMDGRPALLLLILDLPFSFVGDVLTLPVTISSSSDVPLFPARHKVYYNDVAAERITLFRVRGDDRTGRETFRNRVISLLEGIVKNYGVDEIRLNDGPYKANYIFQGTRIVVKPRPDRDLVLEIAVLNEFEQVNIYEELISRLKHDFRRAFGDQFYRIDERRAD